MGGTFDIEWIRRYDLPFQETEGLYNPLNENKPVKISRDGQDLPMDLGITLVQRMEEGAEAAGIPRPKKPSASALCVCGVIMQQPLVLVHACSSAFVTQSLLL